MFGHESPERQKEGLKSELQSLEKKIEGFVTAEQYLDSDHQKAMQEYLDSINNLDTEAEPVPGLQGLVQRGRELSRLAELEGDEASVIRQAREVLVHQGRKIKAAEFLEGEGEDVTSEINDLSVDERQLEYQLDEWRQGGRGSLEAIKKIIAKMK